MSRFPILVFFVLCFLSHLFIAKLNYLHCCTIAIAGEDPQQVCLPREANKIIELGDKCSEDKRKLLDGTLCTHVEESFLNP